MYEVAKRIFNTLGWLPIDLQSQLLSIVCLLYPWWLVFNCTPSILFQCRFSVLHMLLWLLTVRITASLIAFLFLFHTDAAVVWPQMIWSICSSSCLENSLKSKHWAAKCYWLARAKSSEHCVSVIVIQLYQRRGSLRLHLYVQSK